MMNRKALLKFAMLAFAVVGVATSARAVDGVIEINQAAALAGNVALFDAPGFPVTLTVRGSYRLTGELNVPPNTSGIVFQNDNIDLDLNGYSIVGGGGASGIGVETASALTNAQRVSNGKVRAMAGGGILLGSQSQVRDVVVTSNGGTGVEVGENGSVEGCSVIDNDGRGILGGSGTRVLNSNASSNGGRGIEVTHGLVERNIVNDNGADGIRANGSTPVLNNSVRTNAGSGIFAISGPVIGNVSQLNTGNGLNLSPNAGYANNSLAGNSGGGNQVTGGVEIGLNLCGFSTSCP